MLVRWSEMRKRLEAKQKYMFPIFCFLFGVVVGRDATLQAIAPLVFAFTVLGIITMIYYTLLLISTLASVKES